MSTQTKAPVFFHSLPLCLLRFSSSLRFLRFSLLGLICLCSLTVIGDDTFFPVLRHPYQSPRALGMGDAFVAVANDYSAIFYNPAGLARLDEGQVNLSLDFSLPQSLFDFASSAKDAMNAKTDTDKLTALTKLLQDNYGKYLSMRMGLFEGILVRPHWGFAFLPLEMSQDLVIHNQGFPALNIQASVDSTLAYSYGNDIKGYIPARISWGVTAKLINRGYFSKQLNAMDLVVDSNLFKTSDLREGYATDFDLGFMITPHLPTDGWWQVLRLSKPTFGLVVRNIFESKFNQNLHLLSPNSGTTNTSSTGGSGDSSSSDSSASSPPEPPEQLHRVIDIGSRWEYPSFLIFGGRGTLDIRDIGHPLFTLKKGTHLGLEFDWRLTSWWKGSYQIGYNQGYMTAGLSALFTAFRLDLVTYAEEVGSATYPTENRLYMIKMNIDI